MFEKKKKNLTPPLVFTVHDFVRLARYGFSLKEKKKRY